MFIKNVTVPVRRPVPVLPLLLPLIRLRQARLLQVVLTAREIRFTPGLATEPAGRTFPQNHQTVPTQPAQIAPVPTISAGRVTPVIINPAILAKKTADRVLTTGVRFIQVVIQTAAPTARLNPAIRNAAVPVVLRLARRCRAKAAALTAHILVPTVAAEQELAVLPLRQYLKVVVQVLITGVRFIEIVMAIAVPTARSNLVTRDAVVLDVKPLVHRCRTKAAVLTAHILVPTVAAAPELVVQMLRQRLQIPVPV